jgi:hypothetical protein
MPDIRYVCLSDLHLGADSSVLPAIKPNSIEIDPLTTSPALSQFVACLKELIRHNEGAEKPKLILNGDILEYVHYITSIPAGHELPAPWHTTKMFAPDLVQEYFSTNLLQRHPHLQDAVVNVVYPNYALTSDDGQKCIIVSHGHYIESIYSLMITLNTMFFPNRTRPKVVWELEAENFAWIDFLWSTLGRSGDVGQDTCP